MWGYGLWVMGYGLWIDYNLLCKKLKHFFLLYFTISCLQNNIETFYCHLLLLV